LFEAALSAARARVKRRGDTTSDSATFKVGCNHIWRFTLDAEFAPALAKFIPSGSNSNQTKPNKSKQNRLDLFAFIRQIRDFSMDCGDKK
jgi:hypothetical protein